MIKISRNRRSNELEVTAVGTGALLVLIGVIVAAVGNVAIVRTTLPAGGPDAVVRGLSLDYRLQRLAGLNPASMAPHEAQALADDLTRLNAVTIRNPRAKGWGFSRIVRVEVAVDGGLPPDGREVRYLLLRCGPILECAVLDDVSRISYQLGLWFVEPPAGAFPTVAP